MTIRVHTEFDPPKHPGEDHSREPSLTKQSFKDECDINIIVERAGVIPVNPRVAEYGDYSAVPDYLEAQNIILRANEQFASMPSRIRDRFGNDPARLLAFVQDSNNRAEAIELGIIDKPPAVVPPASPPASPPAAPPAEK